MTGAGALNLAPGLLGSLEPTAKILPGKPASLPEPRESSVVKEQVLIKEAYGKGKEVTTGIHQSPEGYGPLPGFSVVMPEEEP